MSAFKISTNTIIGNPKIVNSTINNNSLSDKYVEQVDELKGNLYVENNVEIGHECNCENLVLRSNNYNNRGMLIPEDSNVFVRGNLQIESGSFNKSALGFDGGEYYTNYPYGNKEYKTQLFDHNGPITRELIPKNKRPLDNSNNIIFVINDGMGYNQVWVAKLTAHMLNQYGNFMENDISDNRIGYMDISNNNNYNSFKLSYELPNNHDISMNMDPVCAEMYRAGDLNYLGVTNNRNELISKKVVNNNNKFLVADSAATASEMATGRLTQNEVVNSIIDKDIGADSSTTINLTKGMVYYKTIHEEAKEKGKLICITSTSNVMHATPACFVSKSNSRNNYINLIRTCFGPNGTQPHLIIGAVPQSGNDQASLNSANNAGYDIKSYTDSSGNYIARFVCYNFPEIDNTWNTNEYQLDAKGNKCASVIQYARHYGYTVKINHNDIINFVDNSNNVLTSSSKVFLANASSATPAFICNNGNAAGGDINTLFKVSSRLVDDSNPLRQLNQTEIMYCATKLLNNHPNGYVMMFENSETDWAGHTGDFFGAAFETLEASKALEQVYSDNNLVNKSNIVVTCDHECGGWCFSDISGNIDYEDISYNQLTYDVIDKYYEAKKVHVTTTFVGFDLSFNITDNSKITYDVSENAFLVDPYALVDLSDNTPVVDFTDISFNDLSCNDIRNYCLYEFKDLILDDLSNNNCILPKYLNANIGNQYFRTDVSNNKLYLRRSTDLSKNTNIDLSNNKFLNIRVPVSLLSELYLNRPNLFIDNSLNEFYDQVTNNVLKAFYDENKLYRVLVTGYYNDTVDNVRETMFEKRFVGNTPLGAGKTGYITLHSNTIRQLCSYVNNNNNTIYAINHVQTLYANKSKNSDSFNVNVGTSADTGFSHSTVVCKLWQKSTVLNTTFNNLKITPWSGNQNNKPADFLNGKSVTSMGVRKLLDLSI